jgi:hypothetical protein
MMQRFRTAIATVLMCAIAVLPVSAQTVPRDPLSVDRTNKRVNESFKVPSGKTLTIESGATLDIASGSTASGANLTSLNATQLTTGTVPDARFPATLPAASGANLTNLSPSAMSVTRSGTGAVARTIQALVNERWINVKDFGATGDGTTDDHAAIANAVTKLNSEGGILYFPKGTYKDSAGHTLTGPSIQHPLGDVNYRGNIIVMGEGTASVWKYTGAGTFLTIDESGGLVPSNVVFRDLQIKGPSTTTWDNTTIGVDIVTVGVDYQFDNVQFSNWGKIGLRAYDTTSFGMRQCYFRECKIGLAGDYKFDGVVLDRVGAQECDVGIDLGHYNSARTYPLSPPVQEGVVLLGCIFGQNRIALIIGGASTHGVSVIGGYFESSTDADIDVGHNTVDYSGNAQEGAATVTASITGSHFQSTPAPIRVWVDANLTINGNGYNTPASHLVRLENSHADASEIWMKDVFANAIRTSGGGTIAAPVQTAALAVRNTVDIVSSAVTPLTLQGANTGIAVKDSGGTARGYWALPAAGGAFFTDANANDMIFRSEAHRVLFGTGAGNSTLQVSSTGIAVNNGTTVTKLLSGSGSLNYGSIAAGGEETLTVTVTGAATTGTPSVQLGWSAALEDGIVVKQAWVSGADTVSVRVRNTTAGAIDPAAVTCRATVMAF